MIRFLPGILAMAAIVVASNVLVQFTVATWLDPKDARAHAAAGQVYARQSKWPEAIAALQRGLALDSLHEVPRDRQRHVRLEERGAHLAQRGLHVGLGQRALARQPVEDAAQAVRKGLEHWSHLLWSRPRWGESRRPQSPIAPAGASALTDGDPPWMGDRKA